MTTTQSTVIEGIEIHDIPLSRVMAIVQEYGSAMSSQKIAAILAASSTNKTATELEQLPAVVYARVCAEVMRRLNARMLAAAR